MEIIINGTKVEGNIKEINMTDDYGNVTVLKSSGANERKRVSKGERFYYIDAREHVMQTVELRDSYCDDLYKINNYYVTKEDAEKEVRRRQMRREFGKYFNSHGDCKLTYRRGDKNIKIVGRKDIGVYGIGQYIFLSRYEDKVQELLEKYNDDIIECIDVSHHAENEAKYSFY